MKNKPKKPKVFAHYFAEAGDYPGIVEAEVAFFKVLIDKKDELRFNHSFYQALRDASYFLEDPKGRPLNVLVEFPVNDPRSHAPQTIYLGTKLSPPTPQVEAHVTHYLCLGDTSSLLTKIHHDRDFNPAASEKKPLTHIQTGGRVDAGLAARAAGNCCWKDSVDKPRIPSIPLCTALLWHWAFLEYRGAEQFAPIFEAWWWNQTVQKAEQSVLKPFFVDGVRLLAEKPTARLLDAFYTPVPK
jgi:hypothetical protein